MAEYESLDVQAVNTGAKSGGQLYAARKKIFPKRVRGDFRRLKWLIMLVTLGIYYITPWLRWDRGPYAPDQAILVDIANRRFYAFFIEIWPQEFIFVAGMLVMAGIGLFLVTSVVGRAWCGYACPQTVWTDLFMIVERKVEGDRNARIRLDKAPWSVSKISKIATKHFIWLLIALLTGGAWIFYFADAPTLLVNFVTLEAPTVAYATVGVLTATTYIFGGLMREQVCIYMCPWPRIQAAMLDDDSLTVTYNDWRGEPRTKGLKKTARQNIQGGDCIDCNACVAVCPTGIDIRDGQQLECITCALCIDACNDIMDKIGRERGLISYATLKDYNFNMGMVCDPKTGDINPSLARSKNMNFLNSKFRHFNWKIFLRPRTLIYITVWVGIGLALLGMLLSRDRLDLNVLHDRNPVFVRLSDGSIRNGYTVKILNMIPEPRVIFLTFQGLPGATMSVSDVNQLSSLSIAVAVEPDKTKKMRVFISQPEALVKPGSQKFKLIIEDKSSGERETYSAVFEAPEK